MTTDTKRPNASREITREFRTPEDVLKYIMDHLDQRVADYTLVALLAPAFVENPDILASAPPGADIMLRDPERQIASLRETKELLFDLLVERRALSSANKITSPADRNR